MVQRIKTGIPSRLVVGLLSTLLVFPTTMITGCAQVAQRQSAADVQLLSQAQLASLVAPIALYPDPLVSQILMASTYPLEVAEAANWQSANSNLQGDARDQALQQESWDASVKSLVSFPPVLQMMGSQLSWTQNLGDAVLAQQSDVMSVIQALRAKAQDAGALQSSAQQTVSGGNGDPIIIEPANPQMVYVPTYNPSVVYGAWPYPAYPPVAYYPPGYVSGMAFVSFGVGMAAGTALWGGCHWGGGLSSGNALTINNSAFNNFNRNTNSRWRDANLNGNSAWKPDPQRRRANLASVRNSLQHDRFRDDARRDGFDGDKRYRDRSSFGERHEDGFGDAHGARFDDGRRFGEGGRRLGGAARHLGGAARHIHR